MQNPLKTPVGKQSKKLAQDIVKQMAKEPIEIGKSVVRQVSGEFSDNKTETSQFKTENETTVSNQEKPQIDPSETQVNNRLKELESEIKEISKNNLVKKLQQKIFQGERVSLNDYPQLSEEEKRLLSSQMETVNYQKEVSEEDSNPLIEPQSKKTRNLFGLGKKPKTDTSLQAERQKTRVERQMPPTG